MSARSLDHGSKKQQAPLLQNTIMEPWHALSVRNQMPTGDGLYGYAVEVSDPLPQPGRGFCGLHHHAGSPDNAGTPPAAL